MNAECANKLLKLLEEPPQRTLFLLVSEEPDLLLSTHCEPYTAHIPCRRWRKNHWPTGWSGSLCFTRKMQPISLTVRKEV